MGRRQFLVLPAMNGQWHFSISKLYAKLHGSIKHAQVCFDKYLSVIAVAKCGPLMKGNVSTAMVGEGNKINFNKLHVCWQRMFANVNKIKSWNFRW